ncbi:type II secretion system protein [Massilia arenosa]|uniref:Type II secretion system protein n=1 Tax=Zemynaea arenosa TaxID=2561931 RepID=A0A4Y9SWX6_9BURK|nr:type II secretion system protein [Massilia arenosa]TFW30027.1 type II secretion system protein [Massilia arenosa]
MRRGQGGFTYLGVIVLVMIIGLVTAATLKIDALLRRAAAEEELLEIGAQFSAALRSYAAATPRGQNPQPPTLKELLRDPRVPGLRRHLRKIFVDPMTGKAEWGVMYMGENTGVIGVYSLSDAAPFKVGNFDTRFSNFENKQKISEWRFTASGTGAVMSPGAGGSAMTPPPIPVITPTTPIEPPPDDDKPAEPDPGKPRGPGGAPQPQEPPQTAPPPTVPPPPPPPQEQPENPEPPEPAEPPQQPDPDDKPQPGVQIPPGGKSPQANPLK